ncbi:MAG: transcriptional repressor LexA [Candidatus Eremiobacteraeota bacterium]|nr:transcriptional repressor LexA [Candidatus Eremiobacteraeota bacterium]MBC5804272.1 transcriptional repressor LexA [Candidatus Eremiobacteraeota bacterium]MBC5821111.1 transcriptional repressor LexA [Candidatus Eremiobacteraeota bacterium]
MTERAPSDRQTHILEAIRSYTKQYGYPPSVREIGQLVGLSSSSTVQAHLRSLEKQGFIRRDPTKPRTLIMRQDAATEQRESEYGVLPIVGKVAAGTPITAVENVEGEFVVPTELARKDGTFMLRVQGESMVDAAILDGDLIVVAPQADAASGEIVVAMVDGEATVKRFFREKGRIRLQPENHAMKPIYSDDVTVLGKVEAVYRRL